MPAYRKPRRSRRSGVVTLLLLLIAFVICLLPTELYVLARYVLEPHGFWQEFVLGIAGIWFLGSIQFFLLIILVFAVIVIINR